MCELKKISKNKLQSINEFNKLYGIKKSNTNLFVIDYSNKKDVKINNKSNNNNKILVYKNTNVEKNQTIQYAYNNKNLNSINNNSNKDTSCKSEYYNNNDNKIEYIQESETSQKHDSDKEINLLRHEKLQQLEDKNNEERRIKDYKIKEDLEKKINIDKKQINGRRFTFDFKGNLIHFKDILSENNTNKKLCSQNFIELNYEFKNKGNLII